MDKRRKPILPVCLICRAEPVADQLIYIVGRAFFRYSQGMNKIFLKEKTMRAIPLNPTGQRAWGAALLRIALGVVALAASSQVVIPLWPVPMALSPLVFWMVGLTYSPREALASMISWVTLGVLGAPVFAGYASGIATLLGPRGGYIAGFVVGAGIMAWLRTRFHVSSFKGLIFVSLVGQGVLYGLGVCHLSSFVGWSQVLAVGVAPFVIWDALKIGLAVVSARYIHERAS